METLEDVLYLISNLITSAWALSALEVALTSGLLSSLTQSRDVVYLSKTSGLPVQIVEGVLDVVAALDLVYRDDHVFTSAHGLSLLFQSQNNDWLIAKIRSARLQSQAMIQQAAHKQLVPGWRHTDLELLHAQGRLGSDEMVTMFVKRILPHLNGLDEQLATTTANFLDVGAGVGHLSIAMARRWPRLQVVAIEPASAPRREARQNIMQAALQDRIKLRMQCVEDIADEEIFDLVWFPQMFIPKEALACGLTAVWRALRPDGWIWLPVLNSSVASLPTALSRLRNILWGGNPIYFEDLFSLLANAGFDPVMPVENNATGEHLYVIGRRPS